MSNIIPPMLIELQLETAKLNAQMAKIQGDFKGFGDTVVKQTSALSNFKNMAAGVFTGNLMVSGLQAIKGAITGAIADAQAYEVILAKTNAVIESTGAVAGISAEGLKAQASALENLAAVDENIILNGENVIATFTNIRNVAGENNDIFNQTTLAALDLSAALSQDMQSSAIQLGKALNDPVKGVTALQRVGVAFTASQKQMIKTLMNSGDVLGAQKIILAEVNTEFGGAAKAAGDTFAGAVFRAKDKVGDFTRNLVTGLQPILLSIGKTIGDLYSKFLKPFLEIIIKNKEAVLLLVVIIGTAVVAFKLYRAAIAAGVVINSLYIVGMALLNGAKLADVVATEAQTGAMVMLNAVMNMNPIAKVVLAVSALAVAFVAAWNSSETFRKIIIKGMQLVLNAVGYLVGGVATLLGTFAKIPGMGWAKGLADGASKAAKSIRETSDSLDKLATKKIKLPSFGGGGTTGTGTTTNGENPTTVTADMIKAAAAAAKAKIAEAAAAAKKKLAEIAGAVKDVASVYKDITQEIANATEKAAKALLSRDKATAEAQKNYAKAVAEARAKFDESNLDDHGRYNETVEKLDKNLLESTAEAYKRSKEAIEKLDKRLLEATAAANKKYNDTVIKENKKLTEATANAYERNAARLDSINKDYAKRTRDLEEKLQTSIIDLRKKAAEKSADLTLKASEKQESIVKSSIDRLRNAFASKTSFNLSDVLGKDEGAGDLLANLKNKLNAAKELAQNAAFLQASGFSQTFIEKVVSAGPEVGNSLAESIRNSSPESIKELQATFSELENTSNYGLDALAKTMNSGGQLATKELMDSFAQVSIDLRNSLATVNSDLSQALANANVDYSVAMADAATLRQEKLAEAASELAGALIEANKNYTDAILEAKTNLTEAIADIQKDYDEALAENKKTLNETLADIDKTYKDSIEEAKKTLDKSLTENSKTLEKSLADAQKTLTETLADILASYNDALVEIDKDTKKRIDSLKEKLVELAKTLFDLGEKQKAINAIKNAPTYIPFSPIIPVIPINPGNGADARYDQTKLSGNITNGPTIIVKVEGSNASPTDIANTVLNAYTYGSTVQVGRGVLD